MGPFYPAGPCTNERFEADVEALRAFVRQRADEVRRQAAEMGYVYGDDAPRLAEKPLTGAGGSGAAGVPGSLAFVSGNFPGVAETQAGSLPLPEALAGASVLLNGYSAPLLSVSDTKLTIQVPWEVAPSEATAVAVVNGRPGAPVQVEIAEAAPEVLAVLHPDGSVPTAARPAVAGGQLLVYVTGLGPVDGRVASGAASPAAPLSMTAGVLTAKLGGAEAAVGFSGLAPGMVGLYQLNVHVPPEAPAGERVSFVVQVNGAYSQPFAVAIGAE